jgi:hypothetical protein
MANSCRRAKNTCLMCWTEGKVKIPKKPKREQKPNAIADETDINVSGLPTVSDMEEKPVL